MLVLCIIEGTKNFLLYELKKSFKNIFKYILNSNENSSFINKKPFTIPRILVKVILKYLSAVCACPCSSSLLLFYEIFGPFIILRMGHHIDFLL